MKNKVKILTDVTSFTIKRSKWSRGIYYNKLLDYNGTMCCLGFYTKACGFSKKQILRINTPQDINGLVNITISRLKEPTLKFKSKLVKYKRGYCGAQAVPVNTKLTCKLMKINDDPDISEEERELKIFKIFNKIGIKVRFTK